MATSVYLCELAWLPPGRVVAEVLIEIEDGVITRVDPGAAPPAGTQRLCGLVLPGLANAHSHAFHRALRGRTHAGHGTFWTWRDQMYGLAARLGPERYLDLARATFAEMACAGFTSVGEFHYLHHGPGGAPYDDANEMGAALIVAAREAGVRLALLDTCYLAGGIGRDLDPVQQRFSDGDAEGWVARVDDLASRFGDDEDVVVGAALHSVRAVPRDQIPVVGAWAARHDVPLHAHVSEQPAENEACVAAHGLTPVGLLGECGVLGPRTTAVHATHLTDDDVAALGHTRTGVCLCPTTERDLADGVGDAGALLDAGSPLSLGTDSHALIDGFEEARAVELNLRVTTGKRGHLRTRTLLSAVTVDGHRALGFVRAGQLQVGGRADLVAVDLRSARTAGADAASAAATVLYAASPADITDVVIEGRRVVRDREHRLGDVGVLLREAIAELEVER